MKTFHVLGVGFHGLSAREALAEMTTWLDGRESHVVVTANPLTVLQASELSEYRQVIDRASLVVPDGVGVVWAIRHVHGATVERVPGIQLADALMGRLRELGKSLYLAGGQKGVAEKAAKKLRERHPGIRIVGVSHGFQSDEAIAEEVSRVKPDVVLVGLGQPRQELWLDRYVQSTGASVGMGVGGALDVWAGCLRAAPVWVQRVRLEWLFRAIQQPSRAWRLRKLPVFVWRVMRKI